LDPQKGEKKRGKLLGILPKMHLKCKQIFWACLLCAALQPWPGHSAAPRPGFLPGRYPGEEIASFCFRGDVHLLINAPAGRENGKRVLLVLYALPNGNTLDQTFGKLLEPGDDWHYDIQNIGAQVRFLRTLDPPYQPVLVLMQTRQKSWPAWKAAHPDDHAARSAALVDTLLQIFRAEDPRIMLTGHSGGGRFTFSWLDQTGEIPDEVDRIAFIDSNYGFESAYAAPLGHWLARSESHALMVFAYNDSLALLNGRRVVSDTGGTWHRSGRMLRDLASFFVFSVQRDSAFQHWSGLGGRVQFWLKENPNRGIWHTQQVERNGLIHAVLAGTGLENRGYCYWGERAYQSYIGSGSQILPDLLIPQRPPAALPGSRFIREIDTLSIDQREEAIRSELQEGNLPAFLRQPVLRERRWADAAGDTHQVVFAALPDYLAIGTDSDFVRMPMTPFTAQGVADLYGASLPTRKLVNALYEAAPVKLIPQPIAPVGNRNEWPATFLLHQREIETQERAMGVARGRLFAGHKKDIVISNRMADPARAGHVVIYGWHKPDGQPIQPLTNIHIGRYVDYSHGVRLIIGTLLIDGVPYRMDDILADPVRYALISDEEGPMHRTRYTRQ
jgi:hypothetical protein